MNNPQARGATTHEVGACYNVSVECGDGRMTAMISTNKVCAKDDSPHSWFFCAFAHRIFANVFLVFSKEEKRRSKITRYGLRQAKETFTKVRRAFPRVLVCMPKVQYFFKKRKKNKTFVILCRLTGRIQVEFR